MKEDGSVVKNMNISVKEAAYLHECGQLYIRNAIKMGRMPGSYSCGVDGKGKRRCFKIPKTPFFNYLGISEEEAQEKLKDLKTK